MGFKLSGNCAGGFCCYRLLSGTRVASELKLLLLAPIVSALSNQRSEAVVVMAFWCGTGVKATAVATGPYSG